MAPHNVYSVWSLPSGLNYSVTPCGASYVPIMQVADTRQPVLSTNPMNPVNVSILYMHMTLCFVCSRMQANIYVYSRDFGGCLYVIIIIILYTLARVNVPGLSQCTLWRHIRSGFTAGPEIQVRIHVCVSPLWSRGTLMCIVILQTEVLRTASTSTSMDTWWWIKGDGCDVVKGLCESTQ